MRNARLMTGMLAAAAMMAAGSRAAADCESRDASAAERQYYERSYAALKDVLPPAPASWKVVVDAAREPYLCAEDAQGGFEIEVRAHYLYQAGKDEQAQADLTRRRLDKEIEALRELPADVKKDRQVWLDKMSAANKASNAAYKAGDKALAKQKDAESEECSAKSRAVRDKYWASVQPKIDAIEARKRALSEGMASVDVVVAANERYPHAPQANMGSQIAFGKVPRPKAAGLKLDGVRVVLEGPASRRELIAGALDRAKIEKLVK
jgi:hypothetical protein